MTAILLSICVVSCAIGFIIINPSEEQGDRIMTDVDVTGSITKATVEYLGETSRGSKEYRAYVNVLVGGTGTVTIPKSAMAQSGRSWQRHGVIPYLGIIAY